jgi:hypothetical protein
LCRVIRPCRLCFKGVSVPGPREVTEGVFGSRFWANQAHGVQASGVWLPAPPPEPGCPDAISLLLPASPETPETTVSAEPGSAHAAVSPTNDVLVYN